MSDWKTKLYEGYVSTGQAADVSVDERGRLDVANYPQLMRLIDRHVPQNKGVRMADLGCGHGALVHCLKSSGYRNVEGVDVSSEQVSLAHRLGLKEIRQGDLLGFLGNSPGTYDVLFLMDVLEHLEKQEIVDLLSQMRGALAGGGQAIIHVPNGEGLFGMRVQYGDFTHINCFTPQSIRQVLHACGFRTVEVYEDVPVVHGIKSLIRNLLWHVLTWRERLLLAAETGARGHILSQNMLVVAYV